MSKPFKLPLHKRLLSMPAVQIAASHVAATLFRVMWCSFRVRIETDANAAPYFAGEKPAIFCLWHGRMILFPFLKPPKRKMYALISHHRDGELIAKLNDRFGISCVRGSSSKGARQATGALLEVLAQDANVSITPDGPRGPAHQASRGALHLARNSGKPLVPVSFAASRFTQLKSWDGFIIPHPFARIQVQVGAPICVEKTATLQSLKDAKIALEEALNSVSAHADKACAA